MNLAQIDVIPSRNDIDDPTLIRFAFQLHAFAAQIIDASAFFLFRRISGIEDNSVPTLHRCFQAANDAITQHLFYPTQIHATTLRKRALHKLLVVRALQETMRKAARETLLQLTNLFLRGTGILPVKITVNRLAVLTNDVSDVLRAF
ncbi:hypothetical protein D3C77_503220 [compost metagenome]